MCCSKKKSNPEPVEPSLEVSTHALVIPADADTGTITATVSGIEEYTIDLEVTPIYQGGEVVCTASENDGTITITRIDDKTGYNLLGISVKDTDNNVVAGTQCSLGLYGEPSITFPSETEYTTEAGTTLPIITAWFPAENNYTLEATVADDTVVTVEVVKQGLSNRLVVTYVGDGTTTATVTGKVGDDTIATGTVTIIAAHTPIE